METETYGIIGAAIAGVAAIAGAIWHYWHATPEERVEMRGEALERLVEDLVLRSEAYLNSASGTERKAWVMREINNLSPVDIDQALLDRLIEAAVTRLKNQQNITNAGHRGLVTGTVRPSWRPDPNRRGILRLTHDDTSYDDDRETGAHD